MTKKTGFFVSFFIAVIITGTAHVNLTASEEQEIENRIVGFIKFSKDGREATIFYKNKKTKTTKSNSPNAKVSVQEESEESKKLPMLGELPIIGYLSKNKSERDEKLTAEELEIKEKASKAAVSKIFLDSPCGARARAVQEQQSPRVGSYNQTPSDYFPE